MKFDLDDSVPAIIQTYPREIVRGLAGHKCVLVSSMELPAEATDIDRAWSGRQLPAAIRDLWLTTNRVYLLYKKDSRGLLIYDPVTSRRETDAVEDEQRIEDTGFHEDDVVMGDFQGYDSRLIYSPSDGWLVYNAITDRDDWTRLGDTLNNFLLVFRDVGGTSGDWERPFF